MVLPMVLCMVLHIVRHRSMTNHCPAPSQGHVRSHPGSQEEQRQATEVKSQKKALDPLGLQLQTVVSLSMEGKLGLLPEQQGLLTTGQPVHSPRDIGLPV